MTAIMNYDDSGWLSFKFQTVSRCVERGPRVRADMTPVSQFHFIQWMRMDVRNVQIDWGIGFIPFPSLGKPKNVRKGGVIGYFNTLYNAWLKKQNKKYQKIQNFGKC